MRTHKSESTKKPKRPLTGNRAGSKKRASKRPASHASKDDLVSHENDLFDEEEDFESPRRNPSQARPSEMEEDRPPRSRRNIL